MWRTVCTNCTREAGYLGTWWSGQAVYWKWLIVRAGNSGWLLCKYKAKSNVKVKLVRQSFIWYWSVHVPSNAHSFTLSVYVRTMHIRMCTMYKATIAQYKWPEALQSQISHCSGISVISSIFQKAQCPWIKPLCPLVFLIAFTSPSTATVVGSTW